MIMPCHKYPNFIRSLFSSFIITTHLLLRTCVAKKNYHCPPSSCGNITNISYPFRLQNDPKHCGDPKYGLACEDNTTTVMYLEHSHKYVVREINYTLHTIRIAHPAIKENDICSFPNYSLSRDSFSGNRVPYELDFFYSNIRLVTFMSCPYPVINNSHLLEPAAHCGHRMYGFNESDRKHEYIMFGRHLNGPLIMDNCTIDLMTSVSLREDDLSEESEKAGVSLSEIHTTLLNGLQLSWINALCDDGCLYCHWDGERATCGFSERRRCDVANIWLFPCGGMPHWFLIAFGGMTQIIAYVIVFGGIPYLALRILLGMACILWLLIYILRRRNLSTFDLIEGFLQTNHNLMPIRYSYRDIKKMTRGFKEKLGQGGYGSVYKGKLRSGHIVAVKLLSKPKENGQDFINEIATIGRIHHVNVVKLVGFCVGRFSNKRALVFDFMPNGSLEKHISTKQISPNPQLSWEKKYEIAVGVARGIEYLHRGCDIQILHFDIKPHNILLDDNFTPKISDFGLAKLYSTENNTVTLTAARGTIGYVAPELINRNIGGVSYKADVYSFGMLLIEMVGLNKHIKANDEESSQYFPDWIYKGLNKGKDIETGDADIIEDDDNDNDAKRITRKMTLVGLWCIQMSPADRPSMSEVVKMLESQSGNIQIPTRPSESTTHVITSFNDQYSWGTESSGSIALLGHDASRSTDLSNGPRKCIEMN